MKLNATVSQNETSEIYLVTSYLPLVEQDLIPPPGAQEFTPVFSVVRVDQSLIFCVVFYRSLFVPLSFFI